MPSTSLFEQGIGFVTESKGWVGGGAETYETTDGGDTWQVVDIGTPNRDDNVNRIRVLAPTLAYAIGRKVYRYADDTVVEAPVPLPPRDGGEELLAAARPNPFRDATELSITVPERGPVRLAVYDVLGAEVVVLVDEVRGPGRYQVTLPGTALAAGFYVVRLETPRAISHRKVQRIR